MRILVIHTFYQQAGGEDSVFAAETALLEQHGHHVMRLTAHNDRLRDRPPFEVALTMLWNHTAYRELRCVIRREQPDIIHVHNTFPLVSPSIYYAAHAEGKPVVQTLHNFRFFCANALLQRDDKPCEDCLRRTIAWPGVKYKCYRQSRLASAGVASLISLHTALKTWHHHVDLFIALTEFAREKCVAAGLPGEKMMVKPNFIYPDPGVGDGCGGYALFVGRLSPEKGVATLLRAWEQLDKQIPLKIVGDGPLAADVRRAAQRTPTIEWLGHRSRTEVIELMQSARLLVVPSVWYEMFPVVLAEAAATGLPVIGSDIGGLATLIDHGRSGFRFQVDDVEDLVVYVRRAVEHPEELERMRSICRAEYEAKYTAERNYELLINIYRTAIARRRLEEVV